MTVKYGREKLLVMINFKIQLESTYQALADVSSSRLPSAGIHIHKLQNFAGMKAEPLDKQDTHPFNIVHGSFKLTLLARVIASNK